jgi:hypothetical protein
MTVMSGLALVHLGNYSFTTGWLFWILVAAIFGLYKGMNQHNYYMKQMCLYIKRSPLDRKNLARMIRSVFDQSLIILEFPTYVFIYAVAYYKPRWPAPFESTVGHVEELFHAPALFGLFLVGVGGLLIPVFRSLIKKYSCVARLTRKGDI